MMTVPALQLGPERITRFRIRVEDIWGAQVADAHVMGMSNWAAEQPQVILGADFLQQHRLLFAISQRQLYFSYVGQAAVTGPDGR
jgi:hypothetical protein